MAKGGALGGVDLLHGPEGRGHRPVRRRVQLQEVLHFCKGRGRGMGVMSEHEGRMSAKGCHVGVEWPKKEGEGCCI